MRLPPIARGWEGVCPPKPSGSAPRAEAGQACAIHGATKSRTSSGRITAREGQGNQRPLECTRRAPRRRVFTTLPETAGRGQRIGGAITPKLMPEIRKVRRRDGGG